MTRPIRTNLRHAYIHAQDRQPFACNKTMRGSDTLTTTGQLPTDYASRVSADADASDFYVVYSYNTPIAWHSRGAWTVPPVKYSRTTSRHLTSIRRGRI